MAFETSAVTSGSPPILQVGSGDMVMRFLLPEQAIAGNDGVNLLVQSFGAAGIYYSGLSIVNFNSILAGFQRPPVAPGVSILSHHEKIGSFGGFEQIIMEQESLDLGSVIWPLILELRYDDTTQSFTSAFSTDGGASYATPFSPLPLVSASGAATAYLAAVAYEGDCPAGLVIDQARFGNLGVLGKSSLTMKMAIGGNSLGDEQLRLVLTDVGAGNATLLDVQLPDLLLSTPKCDPRDGWSFANSTRRYRNHANALPPSCTPGSAQGLQRLDIRWTGTNIVTMRVARSSLPPVTGPIRFALYKGTGPVNECDGFVEEADCRLHNRSATCSSNY